MQGGLSRSQVLVINYDVPNHHEDYVHRVGRTGRAGNKGTAITFIADDEERYAPDLVKALRESGVAIPQDLQAMADSFDSKRKAGLVQAHGSGYGGSGFKFDQEEEDKTKAVRKAKALEFGIIEHSESSEDEGVVKKSTGRAAEEAAARTNARAPLALEGGAPAELVSGAAPQTTEQLQAAAAQMAMQLTNNVNTSLLGAAYSSAMSTYLSGMGAPGGMQLPGMPGALPGMPGMNAAAPAAITAQLAAAAAARAAETAARLAAAPCTSTAAAAQQAPTNAFESELEINDFPHQARFKVCLGCTLCGQLHRSESCYCCCWCAAVPRLVLALLHPDLPPGKKHPGIICPVSCGFYAHGAHDDAM